MMDNANIHEYMKKMKVIQISVIDYIENEKNEEEDFLQLKDIIIDSKIQQNQHEFKSFLYLLSNISNNHHRELYFFEKIEKILLNFKDYITKYYLNSEIFNFFKSNKRILLFLLEERIITMDESIAKKIMCGKYMSRKYHHYLWPEIQKYKNENWFIECINRSNSINRSNFFDEMNQLEDDFSEKRKIGESTNIICEMLRNDSVEEFIAYITANKIPVNSVINKLSIYETNLFLLKNKKPSLIEYAAFFGSIQIFRYLLFNKVELPPSLWLYAIHSKNSEIIHILEEYEVDLPKNKLYENQSKYKYVLIESIKCHHIDIAKYFQDKEEDLIDTLSNVNGIKYYNFAFIQNDLINKSLFYYLCKFDYYLLVKAILCTPDIDITNPIVRLIIIL